MWPLLLCHWVGNSCPTILVVSSAASPLWAPNIFSRRTLLTVVAAKSTVWVWGHLIAQISGLNPNRGTDVCLLWMFLCVCVCVSLSVIRCNSNPLNLQCVGKKCQTKEGREKERKKGLCCMDFVVVVVISGQH